MPGLEPYEVRPPTAAEWVVFEMSCTAAQDEYWGIVGKRHIVWTPKIRETLKGPGMLVLAAFADDGKLVGSFIGDLRAQYDGGPALTIIGMASASRLSRPERLCVYYSLLLGGYPHCKEAGIRRGYGQTEASNDLLVEVFERIEQARLTVAGTLAATETEAKRPGVIAVTVDPIDETYEQGLRKCIEAL